MRMNGGSVMSGGVIVADREAQPGSQIGPAIAVANRILFIVVALAAFTLYWLSSYILERRNGTTHFAADTWFYTDSPDRDVLYGFANDEDLSRIFRFHPTTVVVAAGWMKIVSPLARWIHRHYLLKAMFAAVGAIGVWAAMWGFAAVVPRRYAALWGLVYAGSLGVWYFSSIEKSKIVSATLSTLYIAVYLHLRNRWTMRGAGVLTAILLLACLNEIVAGFLVIIPIVDTLVGMAGICAKAGGSHGMSSQAPSPWPFSKALHADGRERLRPMRREPLTSACSSGIFPRTILPPRAFTHSR